MKKFAATMMMCAALALLAARGGAFAAAAAAPMAHVEWSRNANIYEVNIRQYTKEGTINAFAAHLPRLRKMGVDILWIMPVQPIGARNRKGTLGSYYAVRDYTGVNPGFGTLDDFRRMVKQAHALGMHVILDWVANHTAWDHPWATEHSDWYLKNDKGEIYPVTYTDGGGEPEYWTDVIGLDWKQPGLWKGMSEAMAFWVRETDIDGFRCDVAAKVPTPLWNQARADLEKIKPLFMLAEASKPELHEQAFDMTYGWDSLEIFKNIAKGKADAGALKQLVTSREFPRDAYRMRFTSNHDENSWHGHDTEQYGPAFKAMAVLAATMPGMPLIYGGQESGLDKRIEFFEKDPVQWKTYQHAPFYTMLLKLKKDNPALWNGQYGGDIEVREVGNDKVFAFRRQLGKNSVDVAVNLTGDKQAYTLPGARAGQALDPWEWRIKAANK
jgi:glycosidase